MNRITPLLLSLIVVACTSTSAPTAPVSPAPPMATSASAPPAPLTPPTPPVAPAAPAPPEILYSVLWMQTAAEYQANAEQAYNVARMRLDEALASKSWTAASEQTGSFESLPPAVILDADETAVDNSPMEARLLHAGSRFTAENWEKWVSEARARAIPGATEFLKYAKSRGVEIFFITNRVKESEDATRRNFQMLGFPLNESVDTVLLRGENNWTTGDKSPRRAHVAKSYRVLLLIGDDFGDFTTIDGKNREERQALVEANRARWGRQWIILPNAMYGSWERAMTGAAKTEEEKTKAKYDALRVE